MRHRFGFLSALAVAVILAGPAFAQHPRSALPARELNQHDATFVKEAAIGGMAEVEFGKLAQQRAQNDQVKQFGARMVRDHGAANSELTAIATGKGVTMPKQLDQKHMRVRDKLSQLRGADFDRAYMTEMVKDHDEDMKVFQRAANSAADPDIKRFASTTVKVIQDHDRMAHQVAGSLTAVGSSRRPNETPRR